MNEEIMLLIEYTDQTGAGYEETLGVNELAITKEWINRVKSVTEQRITPIKHEGEQAKEYLSGITKIID